LRLTGAEHLADATNFNCILTRLIRHDYPIV